MKVAKDIDKLNFEAVRAAMNGVEAVLEEFPQAGSFLKEFDLNKDGIMNVSKGYSKINFNIEYFSNENKLISALTAALQKNYYHKNMNALGAGAHEMGHIVGRWLFEKSNSTKELDVIAFVEKIIKEAYISFLRRGKFKRLAQLRKELSGNALKNYSECLADAISDYIINGNEASVLSLEIWQIIKEELN